MKGIIDFLPKKKVKGIIDVLTKYWYMNNKL